MTPRLLDISLGRIRPNHRNPRRDVGDVTELADSIREQGLLEPLIVAPLGTGDEYVLIAGHRRTAAAELAGLEQLPCIVRADLDTEVKQIEAMLVENLQRADLTAIEEAAAYEQLTIHGYEPERIAKATGRSKATVTRRLGLMKLPEQVRDRVQAHELTLGDAETLVEFSDNQADLDRAQLSVGTSNWSWIAADIRKARAGREKRPGVVQKLKDQGVKVIAPPKGWPYSSGKTRPVTELAQPDGSDYKKPATQHADCPGHVAIVTDLAAVAYGCTKPDTHPKRTYGRPVDPEAATAAAKLEEDLEVAQTVRIGFLAESLSRLKPTDDLVRTLLRHLALEQLAGAFRDDARLETFCRLLGITPPPEDVDEQEAFDELVAVITALPAGRLAQVLYADRVARREHSYPYLTQSHPWQRRDASLVDYMANLQDLGYQLSDIERSFLEPEPEAAAASGGGSQS